MRSSRTLMAMGLALGLVACGTAGQQQTQTTQTTTTTTTPSAPPQQITLVASGYSVKTDNSDSVTITAVLTDASNAPVSNATVSFSATSGVLSAPTAVTDAYGQASVRFSSGLTDKSNRTATITAQYGTLSAQIPIVISGSTLTVSAGKTTLTAGGAPDSLQVIVRDAGNNPIYNVPVSFTVTPASTGSVTISPSSATTDPNGQVVVDVYGVNAGDVYVQVDAVGTTATQTYIVSGATNAFGITSPATSPYTMTTNTPLTVTVQAPGVTTVRFVSSLGVWHTGTALTDVAVTGGQATATLTSTQAGVATVQVFDASNVSISDTLQVIFAQPSTAAARIALQASANTVAPSVGGQTRTVSLTAKVTDASGQPVADAPVLFYIKAPSGSGESVSPAYALTDAFGQASSVFTAGSLPTSAQGVDVYAQLANVASVYDSVNIVVGGQAASIAIGVGTQLPDLDPATYSLPMSVLVTDGNGSAVSGVVVTLKTWPLQYAIGPACGPRYIVRNNEDTNRNNTLDPGEDQGISPPVDIYVSSETNEVVPATDPYAVYVTTISSSPDGILTPPSAAAGSVPATVTTDQNGVATFSLVYPKSSAIWIKTEVTAQTQVLGTESVSKISFWLAPSVPDVGPPCALPPSPYNPPGSNL